MRVTNSRSGYGIVQIALHWIMAALIFWAIFIGINMVEMDDGFPKLEAYNLHKSIGVTVLALLLLRVLWKLTNESPQLPPTMKPWEVKMAKASHHAVYLLVLLVPLVGWLTSSAAPFPLHWFGMFEVPSINLGEQMAEFLIEVHEILAYILIFLLALHVAAAIKHKVINNDRVFERIFVPAKED